VLHFLPGADDPAGLVGALARPLAPGSFVVISHLTADLAPGPVAAGIEAYNTLIPAPLTPRSHTQVSALFGRLPLVPPGVVPITEWRPPTGPSPQTADLYAGVARAGGPAVTGRATVALCISGDGHGSV
jgi:S-adenosyl methyltransferase